MPTFVQDSKQMIISHNKCVLSNFVAPANGDVRLVAVTSSDNEGLVEMFYPHRAYGWSTVCSNNWDDIEADIVCKQLGYLAGKSKIYGYN